MVTAVSPCTKNFLCNQTKILPQNPKLIWAAYSGDVFKGVAAVSESRNRQIEVMQVLDAVVESGKMRSVAEVQQIKTRI